MNKEIAASVNVTGLTRDELDRLLKYAEELRENRRAERHDALLEAATRLYKGDHWRPTRMSEAESSAAWEALRDAIGLPPGTATQCDGRADQPSADRPGEGYRWVEVGEFLDACDEFCRTYGWWRLGPSHRHIGRVVNEDDIATYRRPIGAEPDHTDDSPGDGWRYLVEGEMVAAFDQMRSDDGTWGPTSGFVGCIAHRGCKNFRRRVGTSTNEAQTAVTVTDAEQAAVRFFVEKHRKIQKEGENYCCLEAGSHADVLHGLLERNAKNEKKSQNNASY